MKNKPLKKVRPAQKQKPPGLQKKMKPLPEVDNPKYKGSGKLKDKVAIITGGDSGIGAASAIILAKEGANIVIAYLNEHKDAKLTQETIESYGQKCLLISGDIGDDKFCKKVVHETIKAFGRLDVLVNNAAEQHPKESITQISNKQLEKTFYTNFFGYFYMVREAVKYLKESSSIINIASVTAFRGSEHLLDYSSTKGAIVAFTRSLSLALAEHKIRVNGIAPGPIWTPLIASTFTPKKISTFGSNTTLKRAGQPYEVAACVAFLASEDSSYFTGQFLHPNGGEIVNA